MSSCDRWLDQSADPTAPRLVGTPVPRPRPWRAGACRPAPWRRRARRRARPRARARRRRRPPSAPRARASARRRTAARRSARRRPAPRDTARRSRSQRARSGEIHTRATRDAGTAPVRGQPSRSAVGSTSGRGSNVLREIFARLMRSSRKWRVSSRSRS